MLDVASRCSTLFHFAFSFNFLLPMHWYTIWPTVKHSLFRSDSVFLALLSVQMCTLDTVGACSCLGRKKEITIICNGSSLGPQNAPQSRRRSCWALDPLQIPSLHVEPGVLRFGNYTRSRELQCNDYACKESRLNRRWRLNHVVIGSVDLYMSFGPPKGSVLEGTSPHSRDPARLVNYYELARYIWVFPKMVVPNNHGVFLLKNDHFGFLLGVPLFLETPIYCTRWWFHISVHFHLDFMVKWSNLTSIFFQMGGKKTPTLGPLGVIIGKMQLGYSYCMPGACLFLSAFWVFTGTANLIPEVVGHGRYHGRSHSSKSLSNCMYFSVMEDFPGVLIYDVYIYMQSCDGQAEGFWHFAWNASFNTSPANSGKVSLNLQIGRINSKGWRVSLRHRLASRQIPIEKFQCGWMG